MLPEKVVCACDPCVLGTWGIYVTVCMHLCVCVVLGLVTEGYLGIFSSLLRFCEHSVLSFICSVTDTYPKCIAH